MSSLVAIYLYAAACVFVAAVVRGYSGFGFSLLSITAISLVMPPATAVPSIFLLEVLAGLPLLPGLWRLIHWRELFALFCGALVGTPFGVYALAHAPAVPMTLALAAFVFVSAVLLARGLRWQRMPGPAVTFATGTASGLANGAFGMGGPPVILFFFSSPAGVEAGRASLIAYFLLSDLIGLAWQGWNGLIATATLTRAALFLPPLAAGVWLGNHRFKRTDSAAARRWALRLLMLLALLTGARALSQLY
ncbi:MAG: sulfite exporter TauE/SafE family protein [Gammaproteobacteria bacterium]|nr:sulfite exporter TauE/SafE family protein [Gammaproteobacteria bacterium]